VRKHAAKNGRKPLTMSAEAMEVLCHYNWRGNVRELENVMERALLLCDEREIQPQHLMMGHLASANGMAATRAKAAKGTGAGSGGAAKAPAEDAPAAKGSNGSGKGIAAGMSMKEAEKKLIFDTLRTTQGNRSQAAKVLSISIRTLRNKLNEYAAEGDRPEFELRD
jgi:DNA-binding NtrC family response regulator